MIKCLHDIKQLKQMVFKSHYNLMKAFNLKNTQKIYFKLQEINHHFHNLPIVVQAAISVFSKLKRVLSEIIEALLISIKNR